MYPTSALHPRVGGMTDARKCLNCFLGFSPYESSVGSTTLREYQSNTPDALGRVLDLSNVVLASPLLSALDVEGAMDCQHVCVSVLVWHCLAQDPAPLRYLGSIFLRISSGFVRQTLLLDISCKCHCPHDLGPIRGTRARDPSRIRISAS